MIISNMCLHSYRRRPYEEAVKRLLQAYPRLGNIQNLQVPRTNPKVWDEMRPPYRAVDGQLQRAQGLIARAMTIGIQLLDQIGTGQGSALEVHLPEISDIVRALSAAFSKFVLIFKCMVFQYHGT